MPHKHKAIKYTIEENGCWNCYSHSRDKGGYPHISITQDKKDYTIKIVKFLWLSKYGLVPDELQLLHTCDNKSCINLDHIFLGTHQDNMSDKVHKNRQSKGENHGRSKLTDEQVSFIRDNHRPNGLNYNQLQLANLFDISKAQINRIIHQESWKPETSKFELSEEKGV
jgi:hypothetical protein